MGKKYEVKDINKNNKIDSWEQAKYDAINSQGPASARFLKRLNNAGGIAGLLQSQPGSQGLLNPNQSMSKVQGMVRQQPTTPMGMDVSTNAQILNQAYDPRMAVNYMDKGMAKKGSIGPAQGLSGYKEGDSEKNENTEDKKIKKLAKKEKENQESDKTSSRKTAANQQKIKNQIDKKKRLEKRAKRKEGRQERKEIRKKAREGKMTRGEKIDAIKSSRDKQKGKKKKETETKSKKVNNNNGEFKIAGE